MKILSVDLGVTTGIFLIDLNNQKEWFSASLLVADLDRICEEFIFDVALLEKFPKTSDLPHRVVLAYAELQKYGAELILPAVWKPFARTRHWRLQGLHSDHEKDAYRMFRYWAEIKGYEITIGE